MEQNESTVDFINLILQPAFTVKNGIIDQVNEAARKYTLEEGGCICEMLVTGTTEYRELAEGCLYLTLSIAGIHCGASVRKMKDFELFVLEQESDETELQVMALAAQELRAPLSNVMTVADQLFPVTDDDKNPVVQEQISRINRGLFQMLRIVSNMSDAYRYSQQIEQKQTVVEMQSYLQEIFEKLKVMLAKADIELIYENLTGPLHTLLDGEKLERAIYNILSNAVKFSGRGGRIYARAICRNQMLYLTVQDNGEGIRSEVQGSVHARYRRKPGLEDSRFGIGLGMVLIRSAAAIHGGTVLIDHPEGCGTRLTMSIAIRQSIDHVVRSSVLRVDYAGERDHPLLELSDVLPVECYRTDRIN